MFSKLVAKERRTQRSSPKATPGTKATWATSSAAAEKDSESVTSMARSILTLPTA